MLAVKISQKLSDYIAQIQVASVKIESIGNDGGGDIGAGFFVAPRVALTCAHVLGLTPNSPRPNLKSIVITTHDNKKYYGQLVDFDITLDVAVIYLNAAEQINTYFLNIGNSGTLKDGEGIVTIGSPLGYMNTVSYGIVSKKDAGNKNYFLMDVRTNPGNSGGLVYSLDKQAIIGIAVAVLNSNNAPSQGVSVGIGIDPVKNILKRNGIKFTYEENKTE